MNARDPLDELRDAWRDLRPEPLDERADPLAALATQRLRDAWRGLQAPAPRIPRPIVAHRSSARRARILRWSLAAGVAGVALYGAWRALASRAPAPVRRADSGVVALVAPRAEVLTVPLAALSRDSMELRSGSVRLLLFTPSAPIAPSTSTDIPTEPRR